MPRAGRSFPAHPITVRPRASGSVITKVTEAGFVQPLSRTKVLALGMVVTEVGTAKPLTRITARPLGKAIENGQLVPPALAKARTFGQPVETGTAWPLQRIRARGVGLVAEHGIAAPFRGWAAVRKITEAGTARPLTSYKTSVLGVVAETGQAQPLHVARGRRVGHAVETGTARPLGPVKARHVAATVEAGTAQPVRLQPPTVVVLGLVIETGTVRRILRLTPPLQASSPFTSWATSPPVVDWCVSSPLTTWSASPPTSS